MTNKIRIALVCTSINQLGGKNIHLRNLYLNLNKDKFEVFIFCCSKVKIELRDFFVHEGVKKEDVIFLSRSKKWLGIPFILELRKRLLDKRIDIVHTFQIQSDIFGFFAASLAGIKSVFSLFESKVIPDNICLSKRFFYKFANKFIKGRFLKTIAVSKGLKEELISGRFRPDNRIEVIHLGFDISEKHKDCQSLLKNLRERKPVIGSISRLSKEKGIDRFVTAMPFVLQKEPQARFVITSKGPEEKKLKAQVRQLGLTSKVTFLGWVEDIYSVLKVIDIFVMPSVREGCPIALLEALASSKPVVASRIEGISDIIDDDEEGLLVDAADPWAFAEKIVFLCRNPGKAILLGENGYRKVSVDFAAEREIFQIEALYLSALEKRR